jgi:hypothetical protein
VIFFLTPNSYVGEVGFHTGLFALSLRSLVAPGIPGAAIGLAATSPLFTYFILRYVSQSFCQPKASLIPLPVEWRAYVGTCWKQKVG